jgi:hypothetical protein
MAMFVIIGIMVISSFMGTPGFAVVTAPQIEVSFNFMPGEKPGPIRSIPFDQMLPGAWTTQDVGSIPDNVPELQKVMQELKSEVDPTHVPPVQVINGQEVRYSNMYAVLRIENAQGTSDAPTLKHLILEIHWDEQPTDPVRQEPGYFTDTFVHKEANYVAGGE